MTSRNLLVGAFAMLVLALACAEQKNSKSPDQFDDGSGDEDGDGLAGTESDPDAEESGSTGKSSGGAKVAESGTSHSDAVSACGKMCDAVAKKCNENDERLCRASCDKYEMVPDECQESAIAAFDCGRKAEDLVCSNVASPSCAHLFEQMASCATLGRVDKVTEYKAPIPAGWKRIKEPNDGFSFAMPAGAKLDQTEAKRAWVATDSDGVLYRAEWFEAPSGRNVDAILLAGTKQFLKDCTAKLRVHGRWDQPDHSGAMFAGQCKDKSGWRGMVRLRKDTIYVLGFHTTDPKKGTYDGFVYSFEFAK